MCLEYAMEHGTDIIGYNKRRLASLRRDVVVRESRGIGLPASGRQLLHFVKCYDLKLVVDGGPRRKETKRSHAMTYEPGRIKRGKRMGSKNPQLTGKSAVCYILLPWGDMVNI